MKLTIDRKIRLGYVSAFLLLIISYFLLFTTTEKVLDHTNKANTSKENYFNLEALNSKFINFDNYYNNYLLSSGNKQYLNKYKYAKLEIDSSLKRILESSNDSLRIEDNKYLQLMITSLKKQYDLGITEFISSKNFFVDTNMSNKKNVIIDSVYHQIKSMQSRQRALIIQVNSSSNGYFRALKIINFTSLFIAIFVAVYSLITYAKENRARRISDEQTAVYRDQLEQRITQLNSTNKELNELKSIEKFAATGRMARMIAHEVRNPLTNIGLANDQLKDAVEPNEENVMLMNMIKRNGERINQLVGDLLNATKFVELNLSKYNINDLIDEVLVTAKDRIELNKIHIIKNYSVKICNVLVDADKIKIAFLNVLLNSIEAVKPQEGKIEISTFDLDKMCVVIVKDNGGGMSKEVLSKLFEPFFTSKDKGNGLGLTNTQNIILNHKGNIVVDSQVGKGTDFTIKLNFA